VNRVIQKIEDLTVDQMTKLRKTVVVAAKEEMQDET
jgi:hypothetical protein